LVLNRDKYYKYLKTRRRPSAISVQRDKGGKIWGEDLTPGTVLQIVQHYASAMGLEKLAPHDMRRTCAKLCRKRGGDLEQIKFLLGHASIQTTERYLGAEQDFISAVNDNLGLEK
jgi:integrase